MLLDGMFKPGKLNQVIVGFDLGDYISQISYWQPDKEEPETASLVVGEEQYSFPTALSKRFEINQWVYGKDATRLEKEKKGICVRRLLSLALEGEDVEVDGEYFNPVALLTLFMKRSFSLLSGVVSVDKIGALMITVERLDHRCIEVLSAVTEGLKLQTQNIFFQSHIESFYNYTIHQKADLWRHQVVLCDFENAYLKTYRLECNRRTTPIVAFVDEISYPELKRMPGIEEGPLPEDEKLARDSVFTSIMEGVCEGRLVSTVYLIGSGFDENWYINSVRFLCKGRRVFLGNNLYSKGACYALAERLNASEFSKNYVFLGNEKLKSNLGMRVLRGGKDSYYALLDAGVNWFEAYKECEFILEDGFSFSILVTPLTGKDVKELEIILDDMPERKQRATKVSLRIFLKAENIAEVVVEDLGFGQIYEATHKIWTKELQL